MCEYKDYEIYKVYQDTGISAKTGNIRPAFEELLQDIKEKKCNTIVVLKLDRLTRSVFDWEKIIKFLEENDAYLDCTIDEHSPHLHIVGVPVKENCKTSLSRQVGKTSMFKKESLIIIQDKMRERCIDEFNITYGLDSRLKEKGMN